jgi:hypothetical protein
MHIATNLRTQVKSASFQVGQLVMTRSVADLVERAGLDPTPYLLRHLACDWGDICDADRKLNNRAVRGGDRLFSSYNLPGDMKLWIITECDRSATTMLLPSDY